MKPNLEETLLTQVNKAKEKVLDKLFIQFKTGNKEEREEIYAKVDVLDKLVYQLKSAIRGELDN